MSFFIKLKHWQLFIVLMITPLLIVLTIFLKSETAYGSRLFVARVASLTNTCLLFGWIFSIGRALQGKLPSGLQNDQLYFKISITVVMACCLMSAITLLFFGRGLYFTLIMIPSVVAIIYMFYFVSKSLRMAELQRIVTTDEFSNEVSMFFFYPIGLWHIQPRINKLFDKD